MTGEMLFDHLSDVVYFIKDAKGAYLVVNQTLAERCGTKDKQAILGRTSAEVLGEPLGKRFTDQDQQVLSTGNPLISQLELHIHRSGLVGWCLTTKLPLRDKKGKVIGLVGVSTQISLVFSLTKASTAAGFCISTKWKIRPYLAKMVLKMR